MTPDRLTALADALEEAGSTCDVEGFDAEKIACREAAAILRSLSVVEPRAWIVTWDDGDQSLSWSDPNTAEGAFDGATWAPLYLHPAVPLLDPPQAPAEGVERDAARYRWLRVNGDFLPWAVLTATDPEGFDDAIDAEISPTTPKGTS